MKFLYLSVFILFNVQSNLHSADMEIDNIIQEALESRNQELVKSWYKKFVELLNKQSQVKLYKFLLSEYYWITIAQNESIEQSERHAYEQDYRAKYNELSNQEKEAWKKINELIEEYDNLPSETRIFIDYLFEKVQESILENNF